uniref:Uncharacterized protein n=1 Tax=Knipowitschia caucasica TaxID=637954 RepID=A0AAV2L7M7_KNICA
MAMEQGRVTEFEGKSLDQIQIEPEGRAVEILSQTDGLKETSSGEPSTIHPDAPHGSGSAPSERIQPQKKNVKNDGLCHRCMEALMVRGQYQRRPEGALQP